MPRARRLATLLLLVSLSGARAEAPALDILVYANAGVFETTSGDRPGGPGGAFLARLETLSGVALRQQMLPISRALLLVEQRPGHCAVAMPRTPEREPRHRWAGPWAQGAMTAYGRGDDPRRISGPQDLAGRSIVVLRDSQPAAWLREQGLPALAVKDNSTALRMLQAGRVDVWLANDVAGHFVIQAVGGTPPRVFYSAGRIALFIACHPGTDPAAVGALDLALARMRRGGELAEFGLR